MLNILWLIFQLLFQNNNSVRKTFITKVCCFVHNQFSSELQHPDCFQPIMNIISKVNNTPKLFNDLILTLYFNCSLLIADQKIQQFLYKFNKQINMTTQNIKKREQYVKIPMKSKLLVLNQIVFGKVPIKQSAKKYNIKYSTAKTFLRQYRRNELGFQKQLIQKLESVQILNDKKIESNLPELRKCSYRMIDSLQIDMKEELSSWQSSKNIVFEQNKAFTLSLSSKESSQCITFKKILIVNRISF